MVRQGSDKTGKNECARGVQNCTEFRDTTLYAFARNGELEGYWPGDCADIMYRLAFSFVCDLKEAWDVIPRVDRIAFPPSLQAAHQSYVAFRAGHEGYVKKKEPTTTEVSPSSTITTQVQKKQVEERVAIGANVVYETIRREGDEELKRSNAALAWSGLAAGLSMGFSFLAEALLRSYLPDQPWRRLITGFGYSVGFLIVILGRQQLFTENTLTVILPLLLRKKLSVALQVLRLWSIVLAANLFGTFLFALVVARTKMFTPEVHQAMTEIGQAHTGQAFWLVFVRAIFAGWLIALMVWLLPVAETSRISIIIIITYLVGIGNLNHIVAGSTTLFYLVASGSLSLANYFANFMLPTLLGNVVGGVSLVAALGHAQVTGGKEA
jgi:formate/nitrite transporter FocA (FNT family)